MTFLIKSQTTTIMMLLATTAVLCPPSVYAFSFVHPGCTPKSLTFKCKQSLHPAAPTTRHYISRRYSSGIFSSSSTALRDSYDSNSNSAGGNNDAAFAAFASSLDEEEEKDTNGAATSRSFATMNDFDDVVDDDDDDIMSWQESLEMLLDPTTSIEKRQILFSDLMGANEEIRESVMTALRDRKVDPILTPTGRKLQDGTKAVARQITMDILPGIADAVGGRRGAVTQDIPTLVPKIGERVFNALSTQARKQLDLVRGDLADPTRIPKRLSKQTADLAAEARNVFSETPEGLAGPRYTVVWRGEGYEVRDYEGYKAAATSMAKIGEVFSEDDVASEGAAFNAIAAYLFGANEEEKSMDMTTPVTTTSLGEMRFYLRKTDDMEEFPMPLAVEDKVNEKGAVKLIDVPPTRLAVARFTGFVTAGEVARQKDAMLNALAMDEVELDVPHGAVVPYFVFQYNPPYTIPMVRRNEIAVPVRKGGEEKTKLGTQWEDVDEDAGDAPSDVE